MTTAVFLFIFQTKRQTKTKKVYFDMERVSEEKLVFEAEWYQSEASVTRQFILNFFTKDNSIELVRFGRFLFKHRG